MKRLRILLTLPVLTIAITLAINASNTSSTVYAAPATFTVTNTNDTGAGSLRQAIIDANSNGNPGDQDIINFNISGAGDKLIQPQSQLTITQSVLINGYTQGDATPNTQPWPEAMDGTIRVEVDASEGGNINVASDNVTIKGLAITASDTYQVIVNSSDNFVLAGSYLGVIAEGYNHYWGFSDKYGGGVSVTSSNNARIGGTSPADRNVVGRCSDSCIGIYGVSGQESNNVSVVGNNIGIAADSVTMLTANSFSPPVNGGLGVEVGRYTSNVKIGDGSSGVGNYVAYNTLGGIYAKDTASLILASNWVMDNKNFWNSVSGPNQGSGITLEGVNGATIGGDSSSKGNTVAGNPLGALTIRDSQDTGSPSNNISIIYNRFGVMDDNISAFPNAANRAAVYIDGASSNIFINKNNIKNTVTQGGAGGHGIEVSGTAQKIAITQNSVYDNQGLGIDLGGNNTVDANDIKDVDSGPNGLLNSPGYTKIVEDGGNTEVTFTADLPAGDYRIEFFSNTVADPSGFGEGETYLGYVNITHDGNGLQEFSHTLTGTGHTNLALTATEIDLSTPSGFGATSEFGSSGDSMPPPPVIPPNADISIRTTLLNPHDYALNNTLNYQIILRNNGPDSLDISKLNDYTPPGTNQLFSGILPANLTYAGVSGDVSCLYYGDGTAVLADPLFENHSNYGILACAYSGASPRILGVGDTLTLILHTQVTDASNPTFSTYIFSNTSDFDPDASRYQDAMTSGGDIVDYFSEHLINNFSAATSTPTDIAVSETLSPNQDLQIGGPLKYLVTFTNHGASPIDPTQFNAGGLNPAASALFIGALPPNSSFVSSSNPDVTCSDMGGATFGDLNAGAAFTDVVNHKLVICAYTGSNHALGPGQSITTTLNATLNSLPSQFSSYALTLGSASDPDFYITLSSAYSGIPIITTALARGINNVAKAIFDSHYYDQDNDGTPDDLEDIINGNTNGLSKPPPINTRKVASNYPSNGDGNGDGTPDRQQSNVTTIINPVTGYPITLEAKGDCQTIDHFTVKAEGDLQLSDAGYNYPVGLNDFRLSCATPGGTSTVTVYYDRAYDTSKWIPRKYIDNKYHDLGSAKIGTAEVNGLTVSTITYDLTDGGNLDSDHQANGVITDPAGPATPAPLADNLADTTSNVVKGKNWWILIVGIVILLTTILIFFILRRRKNQQNQQTSINNNWRG